MDDLEFLLEDDNMGQVDWNCFFDDLPDGIDELASKEVELPLELVANSSPTDALSNPSSASGFSRIDQIENILMQDDDENNLVSEHANEICDSFFTDVLVDAHGEGSSEVLDAATGTDSNASDDRDLPTSSDKDKIEEAKLENDVDQEAHDPVSKKRRRQLRNRDAAVKSRERKKMYVKDLEMKSIYLEGECRRLSRLLQCCYAENQALGLALGASMAKQESAVLFLESLLLGSLLWFLGIMCFFTLPLRMLLLEEHKKRASQVLGRGLWRGLSAGGSKERGHSLIQSFVISRRCRAARTRMKLRILVI